MPQPYNYTAAAVPSPLQSFNSGLQSGAAVQEMQTAQQQKQQALEQAKQLRIDLAEYQKNPSTKGIATLSMKYPQLSEQFKRSYDMLAPEEQQARITSTVPIYAAIQNNKPEIAIELLEKASEASKNSGNEPQAAQQKAIAEMIKANPKQASTMVGLLLASTMGPDKFATTFTQLEGESRANAEQPNKLKEGAAKADIAVSESVIKAAEAGNVGTAIALTNEDKIGQIAKRNADIKELANRFAFDQTKFKAELAQNAKKLGFDVDKFTSELQLKLEEMRLKAGELPEYVAKEINTASLEAVTAQESGKVLLNLANEFDAKAQEFDTGLIGKGTEAWKKIFGSANELTRIRANYKQLVTQQAMAAYKKVAAGSTSDKDIDTAMTGYPAETDSVEIISAKLRGMAKLAQYDSVLSNAKSEWLAANKNLAKAKQDLEIDGVGVPAGTTFKNFSDAYVTRKAEELGIAQNADANLKAIQNRPYMKYVKPEGTW